MKVALERTEGEGGREGGRGPRGVEHGQLSRPLFAKEAINFEERKTLLFRIDQKSHYGEEIMKYATQEGGHAKCARAAQKTGKRERQPAASQRGGALFLPPFVCQRQPERPPRPASEAGLAWAAAEAAGASLAGEVSDLAKEEQELNSPERRTRPRRPTDRARARSPSARENK